ncbi:hypothetical protein CDAR_535451 [Caerostris darwini]|uniref:Uncharacterized protein n=1 Tax=Caerostris darwini TaxID=1538125 RepID=A0AAV4V2M2_9ARAC|nr:hypothetical protein CDAR_535451 [Caerostris darwini]
MHLAYKYHPDIALNYLQKQQQQALKSIAGCKKKAELQGWGLISGCPFHCRNGFIPLGNCSRIQNYINNFQKKKLSPSGGKPLKPPPIVNGFFLSGVKYLFSRKWRILFKML